MTMPATHSAEVWAQSSDHLLLEVFHNLEEVLREDYRHPIPTGIGGIDNLLNGGLAKGEIGAARR